MFNHEWIPVPRQAPKGTPEEVREHLELYRPELDAELLEDLKNWDVDNLVFDYNSQAEIDQIIKELLSDVP